MCRRKVNTRESEDNQRKERVYLKPSQNTMSFRIINAPLFLGDCLVVPRPSRVTPTNLLYSVNGQFSPGYAKEYFEIEVFAGVILNTKSTKCNHFPAVANIVTDRFSNLTGQQESFKIVGSWMDGKYFFSYPVPFARTVNVTINGTQIALLEFSFNDYERYLGVLYTALGMFGFMVGVLFVTFYILRRKRSKSQKKRIRLLAGKAGSSFISKLPKTTPMAKAPTVNARRPGANTGDTEEFRQALRRQQTLDSIPEEYSPEPVECSEAREKNKQTGTNEQSHDEETELPAGPKETQNDSKRVDVLVQEALIRTKSVYVGMGVDIPGKNSTSKLRETAQKIFGSPRAGTRERRYSQSMAERRLHFANIMRNPPKRVEKDATNMLRGNAKLVSESELNETQRKALAEMKMAALIKYKSFVPRSYLAIAVWLEATVCHTEEFERCFGMSVFDAAKTIHTFLVQTVPPSMLKPSEKKMKPAKDHFLIRDGFHFATIAIVHLLLVSLLSSGLFISKQMKTSVTTSISLAVALDLIFVLPFMTSMSENASYYLYQGLYAPVPVIMSRDLAAGLCSCVFPSFGSVLISLWLTEDGWLSLKIGVFAVLFSCFMLLYTMLYLFHCPYEEILIPSGRNFGFVFLLLVVFMIPFMLSMFGTPNIRSQSYWLVLHTCSMFGACVLTAGNIRRLARAWQAWLPVKIKLAHRMKTADEQTFKERLAEVTFKQRCEALHLVNVKQDDPSTWATFEETGHQAFWDYFSIEVSSLRKRAAGQIENPICMSFDVFSGRMFHAAMLFLLLLLSSLPVFFEGPTSAVSRSLNYTLLAFMLTTGFLEIFVYDVSIALDKDEDRSRIFLMPASPQMILHVQNFLYSNILVKYATVTTRFQATTFFWSLVAAMTAYVVEPSALILTAPFSLGYDYVAYAMLSRMFFVQNPFAVRVDVASAFSVLNAIIILMAMIICTISFQPEKFWVINIVISCLFQLLRFIAVEVTAYDPSSRYSWQPDKSLSRHILDRKVVILHAICVTVPVSIAGFYIGCMMSAVVTSTLFSENKDLSLAISFVLFKSITSALVFGTSKSSLKRQQEQLQECALQIKGCLSVSLVIGVGYVSLSPTTTSALTAFVAGAIVYCHGLQTLLLKPSYLLHRPLDVADVPITSGKRSLAYNEGLTESLMKEKEQIFTAKLLRTEAGKRLKFEIASESSDEFDPLVYMAHDILASLKESLDVFLQQEDLSQLFAYMVFLLEALCDRLAFEDSIRVFLVDKYLMQSEGFLGCASENKSALDTGNPENWHKELLIYVSVDPKYFTSFFCCFNHKRVKLLRETEEYHQIIGELCEVIFHEFVENEVGSHKFASVAELIVRSRYHSEASVFLPENIIRQLKQLVEGATNDFERVHSEIKLSLQSEYRERMPLAWPFSRDDWNELCHIEREFNEEVCNFCETLAPRRSTKKIKWRIINWARLYYMALAGDLEVNREIRSYLEHYKGRVWLDKFGVLLTVHEWISRPLFEGCVWLFAWTCSPLYRKLKSKDLSKADVHRSIKELAPERCAWSLDLRPVLFETLEAKDQGQTFISGILCTVVDEIVLRRAEVLKLYWQERRLITRQHMDNFTLEVEKLIEQTLKIQSSQMRKLRSCHKAKDLLIMGGAGNSILTENSPDTEKLDCVLGTSGTVLYVSGGVTTCLMQLLSCRPADDQFNFHVLCEVASASTSRIAIPPQSVVSVHTVPLHELSRCPEKFIHSSVSYFKLSLRKHKTTTSVLKTKFFPLLRGLIYCLCDEIGDEQTTDVFVFMYEYFEEYDWDSSWLHPLTWKFWVKTWVSSLAFKDKYQQKIMALTIAGLREGLIFFSQLLRCLCCTLPPANIYHSSHHGIGAIKGVIHKRRYKSSFVIWDHGLLLRERMAAFCEDDCTLDPFTKNALITISSVIAKIAYNNADIICPCTSCEMYKIWILRIADASPESEVAKRIQPISNGAAPLKDKLEHKKIDNFYDDEEMNRDGEVFDPNCVHACMLSHVLPIKDLQNAVRAADYIVNTRGLTCYRLQIFGALDKDPKYAAKCQNLVKELNLTKYVRFHGLGPKLAVLPKADVFVNSSASEGLPCALLEASMAKVPVCCTDVGGSRQIITDPRCLAPPQDPISLGFAQLSVLTGFKRLHEGADVNAIALSEEARKARRKLGERQYDLASSTHIEDEVFERHVQLMSSEALRAQHEIGCIEAKTAEFNYKERTPWIHFDEEDAEDEQEIFGRDRTRSMMSMGSMQSMTDSVAKIMTSSQLETPSVDPSSNRRPTRSSTISDFMQLLDKDSQDSDSESRSFFDLEVQRKGSDNKAIPHPQDEEIPRSKSGQDTTGDDQLEIV